LRVSWSSSSVQVYVPCSAPWSLHNVSVRNSKVSPPVEGQDHGSWRHSCCSCARRFPGRATVMSRDIGDTRVARSLETPDISRGLVVGCASSGGPAR
jgi:hypothetical protein